MKVLLITDSTSQLYYSLKRNTRPVHQRAVLPFIWFQANPVPGTECVKQTPAQKICGTPSIQQEGDSFLGKFAGEEIAASIWLGTH